MKAKAGEISVGKGVTMILKVKIIPSLALVIDVLEGIDKFFSKIEGCDIGGRRIHAILIPPSSGGFQRGVEGSRCQPLTEADTNSVHEKSITV